MCEFPVTKKIDGKIQARICGKIFEHVKSEDREVCLEHVDMKASEFDQYWQQSNAHDACNLSSRSRVEAQSVQSSPTRQAQAESRPDHLPPPDYAGR